MARVVAAVFTRRSFLVFVSLFLVILLISFRSQICFNIQEFIFFHKMENSNWGQLSKFEKFGRPGDDEMSFVPIDYDYLSALVGDRYKQYTHAAHGMFYARDDTVLWNLYKARGAVLMQVRFDGLFGFPGGLVEPEENPVDGLNREMAEEIGLDLSSHKFTWDHHVQSFFHADKQLVLHFFVMEITMDQFHTIEMKSLFAPEYGVEVFGIVRVPLFTMGDGVRGFPAFLSGHFAGSARQELILGLRHVKLLSEDELNAAIVSSNKFLSQMIVKKK